VVAHNWRQRDDEHDNDDVTTAHFKSLLLYKLIGASPGHDYVLKRMVRQII